MNILTVYLFCFLSAFATATVLQRNSGYDCGGWSPRSCPEGFHCDYLFGDRGHCHKGETDHHCGEEDPCPEGFHCDYEYGHPRGDGRCHKGAFHPTDKPSIGEPRSE